MHPLGGCSRAGQRLIGLYRYPIVFIIVDSKIASGGRCHTPPTGMWRLRGGPGPIPT